MIIVIHSIIIILTEIIFKSYVHCNIVSWLLKGNTHLILVLMYSYMISLLHVKPSRWFISRCQCQHAWRFFLPPMRTMSKTHFLIGADSIWIWLRVLEGEIISLVMLWVKSIDVALSGYTQTQIRGWCFLVQAIFSSLLTSHRI